MAEIAEAIVSKKRDMSVQMEGADRRVIIACLERGIAKYEATQIEFISITSAMDQAWGHIGRGAQPVIWKSVF